MYVYTGTQYKNVSLIGGHSRKYLKASIIDHFDSLVVFKEHGVESKVQDSVLLINFLPANLFSYITTKKWTSLIYSLFKDLVRSKEARLSILKSTWAIRS